MPTRRATVAAVAGRRRRRRRAAAAATRPAAAPDGVCGRLPIRKEWCRRTEAPARRAPLARSGATAQTAGPGSCRRRRPICAARAACESSRPRRRRRRPRRRPPPSSAPPPAVRVAETIEASWASVGDDDVKWVDVETKAAE